jgi:hypothetical protein
LCYKNKIVTGVSVVSYARAFALRPGKQTLANRVALALVDSWV